MPCLKTLTVFISALALILRTNLFVNVRTNSLINSAHRKIYYVVWYTADSDWREFWTDFSFPYYILCSFNLLYFCATLCLVKIKLYNVNVSRAGKFSRMKHVLVVGTGGALPHFSDFDQHVRLGDIVVSAPRQSGRPLYIHCQVSILIVLIHLWIYVIFKLT